MKPGTYTPEAALAALDADRTADAAALQGRIAALEAALIAPGIQPEEWTDEQVAEFKARFAEAAERHEMRLMPSPPTLEPGQVRHLLAECVTVVKPGETLVLRCPEGWTPEQAEEIAEHVRRWVKANEADIRVLVVPHLDMAVVQPETDADLIARLERVFPELSRRQMKREAMNWPGQSRPKYPASG